MTRARVIARLDIKGDNVVRGIHLEGLRKVGRPEEMAIRYCEAGIDELIFIDTVASLYGRNNTLAVVERTAQNVFLPLTVGGGIRSLEDVEAVLRAGADKVAINSAAIRDPDFITRIATRFGSQCVVVAIEAKRQGPNAWTALVENGREATGRDAVAWAREAIDCGAGELLLTSIDADGTRKGCDLDLFRAVAPLARIPLIGSGGPGKVGHVVEAFAAGNVDAMALGSLLHFQLGTVAEVKTAMRTAGLDCRAI